MKSTKTIDQLAEEWIDDRGEDEPELSDFYHNIAKLAFAAGWDAALKNKPCECVACSVHRELDSD